jgi:hypothetical protein
MNRFYDFVISNLNCNDCNISIRTNILWYKNKKNRISDLKKIDILFFAYQFNAIELRKNVYHEHLSC